MTRHDVLSKAIDECIKEFYSIAVPHVEWEDLKEQCKLYSKAYLEWEDYKRAEKNNTPLYQKYNEKLGWQGKTITECIGPRPYEFYYLPNEIQKDIADSYVYAYKFDNQQELLDTIKILKNYCKDDEPQRIPRITCKYKDKCSYRTSDDRSESRCKIGHSDNNRDQH